MGSQKEENSEKCKGEGKKDMNKKMMIKNKRIKGK
jgi:hypothetical protein